MKRTIFLSLALLLPGRLAAQGETASASLQRGVSSYQALELDAAALWFRRALTPPAVEQLSARDHVRALTYLAATEQFRGKGDSAAVLFRRALRMDPAVHPDPLVFPPEVMRVFDQVRIEYPVVQVLGPERAIVRGSEAPYQFRLRASVPHDLLVTFDRSDGRPVDTLYQGPIGESLELHWNGREDTGVPVRSGRYAITATSVASGPGRCRVRLPLQVVTRLNDTLAVPGPFDERRLLPERGSLGDGSRSLAAAAFLTGAALLLPVFAEDVDPLPGVAVAGTIGIAGIVGLVRNRPGRPIPGNIAANAAMQEEWRERQRNVIAENKARRTQGSSEVRSSEVEVIGCGGR